MNTEFLRNLYLCFGRPRTPGERDLLSPHFRIFDRDGYIQYERPASDEMHPGRRFARPKFSMCEAYVYGGETDRTIVFELRDAWSTCREDLERFVRGAGGSVEELRATWLVRLEIPLTEEGARLTCQLADVVERRRAIAGRRRHRLRAFAISLRELGRAISRTAGVTSISRTGTCPDGTTSHGGPVLSAGNTALRDWPIS